MVRQFISNFFGVKVDDAVNGAMEALVRFDPKAATEAELRTMEQNLDQLGRNVADARATFDKEHKEAEAIRDLHAQRMSAAEKLQAQYETEQDAGKKAGLEKSLGTILTMLEKMQPELDREEQEAQDAKEFLDLLSQRYQEAGEKLKTARSALEAAQRDMARSAQQRQIAEERAEAARQAAGLTKATSTINVALKAMQDNAERNTRESQSLKMKADMLRPSNPEQEDANIAAAMREAAGVAPAPTGLADRLAALKSRKG